MLNRKLEKPVKQFNRILSILAFSLIIKCTESGYAQEASFSDVWNEIVETCSENGMNAYELGFPIYSKETGEIVDIIHLDGDQIPVICGIPGDRYSAVNLGSSELGLLATELGKLRWQLNQIALFSESAVNTSYYPVGIYSRDAAGNIHPTTVDSVALYSDSQEIINNLTNLLIDQIIKAPCSLVSTSDGQGIELVSNEGKIIAAACYLDPTLFSEEYTDKLQVSVDFLESQLSDLYATEQLQASDLVCKINDAAIANPGQCLAWLNRDHDELGAPNVVFIDYDVLSTLAPTADYTDQISLLSASAIILAILILLIKAQKYRNKLHHRERRVIHKPYKPVKHLETLDGIDGLRFLVDSNLPLPDSDEFMLKLSTLLGQLKHSIGQQGKLDSVEDELIELIKNYSTNGTTAAPTHPITSAIMMRVKAMSVDGQLEGIKELNDRLIKIGGIYNNILPLIDKYLPRTEVKHKVEPVFMRSVQLSSRNSVTEYFNFELTVDCLKLLLNPIDYKLARSSDKLLAIILAMLNSVRNTEPIEQLLQNYKPSVCRIDEEFTAGGSLVTIIWNNSWRFTIDVIDQNLIITPFTKESDVPLPEPANLIALMQVGDTTQTSLELSNEILNYLCGEQTSSLKSTELTRDMKMQLITVLKELKILENLQNIGRLALAGINLNDIDVKVVFSRIVEYAARVRTIEVNGQQWRDSFLQEARNHFEKISNQYSYKLDHASACKLRVADWRIHFIEMVDKSGSRLPHLFITKGH